MESRRLASMNLSVAANADMPCQHLAATMPAMDSTLLSHPPAGAPALEDCAVIELRDYTLYPGQRDVLIELFEREFIESQEALGMRVIGQFRDLDRPDHFVWLRGFADMAQRRRGLESFYGGPVWQAHRQVANATMVDSDDVRLLRYARPAWALASPRLQRPRVDDDEAFDALAGHGPAHAHGGLLLAICTLASAAGGGFARRFEREALPRLRDAGAMPVTAFETETATNDFPKLPVRTDAPVFAWMSRGDQAQALRSAVSSLDFMRAVPLQVMRLQPCTRSWLR
jgi:hypothetical protein